jgi:hypothetical protein
MILLPRAFEEKHQGGQVADPMQHLGEAVEEIATLLLRRQLER